MATLASCSKENLGTDSTDASQITVLANAPGVDSKSVLGEDGFSVLWEDGDKLLAAARPTNYYAQRGYTERTSTLSTTLSISSEKAYFKGSNPYDNHCSSQGILFYPSSVSYKATTSETITFELPSEQTAGKGGSFGSQYNLTAAYIDFATFKDNSVQTVNFRNACALIRFILPEGVNNVTSVTVSSSETVLAGNANLSKETTGSGLGTDFQIHFSSSIDNTKNVTLDNDGQCFVPGVEYNVVVWPGNHSANALTFTFTNSDGGICTKNIPYAISLNENGVTKFNFTSSFEYTYPAPVYVVTEEIQEAELLVDGETYIIAWNADLKKCLINNNGCLELASFSSTAEYNEYEAEHVFVFNKKSSALNGAEKYLSKTAATFKSLSTGMYIDSDINVKATEDRALELVVANLWSGNVGARMDIWRNQTGDKKYLYYSGSIVSTAIAGTAEAYAHQEGRKWNFYKVERK